MSHVVAAESVTRAVRIIESSLHITYTVFQKKFTLFVFTVTKSDFDQF